MSLVEFDHFPIDGAALVAGAAAALLVVRAEDGVKRPTVKHLGWHVSPEPHQVWGHFYYFRFHGLCRAVRLIRLGAAVLVSLTCQR